MMAYYARLQGIALRQAEVSYRSPAVHVMAETRRVSGAASRVEGPIRITRHIVEPGGRSETIVEERGSVIEQSGPVIVEAVTGSASFPVLPSAGKKEKLIVGGMVRPSFSGQVSLGFVCGYSFVDRLDLLAMSDGRDAWIGLAIRW
jgi:hypothetical protein